MFDNHHTKSYKPATVSSKNFIYDRINNYTCDGIIHCFLPHFHDALELIFIHKGQLNLVINGQNFTAEPGDTLVFNPFDEHCGFMDESCNLVEYQCVCIDLRRIFIENLSENDIVNGLIERSYACDNLIKSGDSCAYEIAECMKSIDLFCTSQNYTHGSEYCLLGLIFLIIGFISSSEHLHKLEIEKKHDNFALSVLNFIEINYHSQITTENIARQFSYNPSYFCRLFKQTFGTSFHSYLTEYRINRAKSDFDSLLSTKQISSIADLASKVGFSDYCYFARTFKKLTGLPPSEYFKFP